MVLDMTTPKKKLPPALAARARAAAAMTPAQRAAWAKKMQAARKAKAPRAAKNAPDYPHPCPPCNGTGIEDGRKRGKTCRACNGAGMLYGPPPPHIVREYDNNPPKTARKNAGRAFVDYEPIARNPPAVVGAVVGEPYLDHLRAQRDKLIAKRATHRKNSAAWEAADNAVRAKAKELAQEMRAFYATVTADAEARTQRNPPKKTSAKNPPIRVPAREALSALYSLSIADSDQAAAKFERLMDADRDSLTVARIPLAVTGSRTVRLWWTETGAPIQIRVTFEDESPNRADFAAFNEKHRT